MSQTIFCKSSLLREVSSLVFDDNGILYASNFGQPNYYGNIIKIDKNGNATELTNLGAKQNNFISCIAYYNNYLYVCSYDSTGNIYKVNINDGTYSIFSTISGLSGLKLNQTHIVYYQSFLYVPTTISGIDGGVYKINITNGQNNLFISQPTDVGVGNIITVDINGIFYIYRQKKSLLQKFDNNGILVSSISISIDSSNIWVTNIILYNNNFYFKYNNTISQFDINGNLIKNYFCLIYNNGGMVFDKNGNFYVSNEKNGGGAGNVTIDILVYAPVIKNIEYLNIGTPIINVSYTDTVNNVTYYGGRFKKITLLNDTIMDANSIFGINNNTKEVFRLGIQNFNGVVTYSFQDFLANENNNIENLFIRNKILYVFGRFNYVNDKDTTNISPGYPIGHFALWDITNKIWIKNSNYNLDYVVHASVFDTDKDLIYLGGSFVENGKSWFAIFDMNTKDWKNINLYVDNRVLALYYDKTKNNLYVGGSFTKVGYTSTNTMTAYRIAILNTNTFTWSVLGSATSNGVDDFQTSYNPFNEIRSFISYNNNLLQIKGFFTKVYDSYGVQDALNYATWDTLNNKWILIPMSTSTVIPNTTTSANITTPNSTTRPNTTIPNTTTPNSTTKPNNTTKPNTTTSANITTPNSTTIPNTSTTNSTPVPLISENYTFITSLRVPASKGDTKIYVEDDSKFKIGDVIQIGTSDITIAKVIGFGSLLLDTPLKFDYNGKVPVGIIAAEDNKKPIDYTIYIIIAVIIVIIICSSSLLIINKN